MASHQVDTGIVNVLANILSVKLKTEIEVWRYPKGKGFVYSINFKEYPAFNHVLNRNGLTVEEVKRFLVILSDMCHHRVIGPWSDASNAEEVYLRDLDGTGSMHICAKGDPGAVLFREVV